MINLILSDLDHTLLREDGSVSDYTLSVIERCREKGVKFAIATARYRIGAEKYIEMLSPDFEITTDGTLIHSGGGCIYSARMSAEQTNMIIGSIMEACPGAEITVADEAVVYWNSHNIAASEKLHKAVYCDYSGYLDVRANKIVAELPDEAVARGIAEKACCCLQCYRGERWYAFLPEGSGKTAAIKALSQASGIPLEDMAAFGDDSNDVEMLRLCGVGVAVANAVPEAIEAADEVTLSNEDDGVAAWVEEHIL